jgi:hypothetical protein
MFETKEIETYLWPNNFGTDVEITNSFEGHGHFLFRPFTLEEE